MIPIPLFLAIFAIWVLCLIGVGFTFWHSGKAAGTEGKA